MSPRARYLRERSFGTPRAAEPRDRAWACLMLAAMADADGGNHKKTDE